MIENTNAKNSVPHHFLNLAQFIINFRSAEFKVSYGWLTTDERLTHFIKAIYQILGRLKRSEYPSIKGPQSSEEGLVVREKYQVGLRGHKSENLVQMITMWPFVNHITSVTVKIDKKYPPQLTIWILSGLNTNMLKIQEESLWRGIYMREIATAKRKILQWFLNWDAWSGIVIIL